MTKLSSKKLLFSAMLLALALILPLLTGQIPEIGKALCPMHLPVLLCGFICGPFYGLVVGFIAPLLRFVIFGMPQIFPTGLGMAFELATYGFMTGFLHCVFKKNKLFIYISLIIAMISGRLVWGLVRSLFYGLWGAEFGLKMFLAGALLNSIPGIIVQIILVPLLVILIEKIFVTKK